MVGRHTDILRSETTIEEELVGSVALDIAPTILAIVATVGIDILEDEFIYSRRAKVDGSLHILTLEEAIHAHKPSILALLLRA